MLSVNNILIPDFTQFVQDNPIYNMPSDLVFDVMEDIKRYLNKFVLVRFQSKIEIQNLTFPDMYPDKIPGFIMDSDLHVILLPEVNETDRTIASGTSMYLSPLDRRPILGKLYVNLQNVVFKEENRRLYFSHILHQIVHIMGFSNHLYKHFYYDGTVMPLEMVLKDLNGTDKIQKMIISPSVVDEAKKTINCSSIEGVLLSPTSVKTSNFTSHWDKEALPYSFMTEDQEYPSYIDKITIALLKDSGWYFVSTCISHNSLIKFPLRITLGVLVAIIPHALVSQNSARE